MTAYDLKSYALAIQLRSRKTLLVEGATDKRVISRLILERELSSGLTQQCLVDDVSLLSRESTFSGIGHKQRVELAAASLAAHSAKLNWLVDREWEGVDLANLADPIPALPPAAWGHRTKGHSIENYWFHADALVAYLKMSHGADLSADCLAALSQRFEKILRIAVAFSLAARRLQIITVCMKLVEGSHIRWTGSEYLPEIGMTQELARRGAAADLAAETLIELKRSDLQGLTVDALRWLCHGHLGEEMVRACAANLAAEAGAPQDVCRRIERGFHSVKLSHDADWLSRAANEVDPLDELVKWAV